MGVSCAIASCADVVDHEDDRLGRGYEDASQPPRRDHWVVTLALSCGERDIEVQGVGPDDNNREQTRKASLRQFRIAAASQPYNPRRRCRGNEGEFAR